MPHRYFLDVGSPITVEVQQQDGGRARVVGVLDRVPLSTYGGYARCLQVIAEEIRPLAPRSTPGPRA
jgi:hypothetical protein